MNTFPLLAAIFIGGGLGAVTRFLVEKGITRLFHSSDFPVGIFFCNVLGSFLIGLLVASLTTKHALSPLLITGFLGAFTTFSTFSLNTLNLIQSGKVGLALLNAVLSVVAGLVAVYVGLKAGKIFF